jgi:hypothetical protein
VKLAFDNQTSPSSVAQLGGVDKIIDV